MVSQRISDVEKELANSRAQLELIKSVMMQPMVYLLKSKNRAKIDAILEETSRIDF